MTLYAALGAVEQGFVYGIMVIGVYLTFRILDFPDLTVDGSLPLGAAISAVAITSGVNPYLSLLFALAGGFLAGMVTAFLNTKFKILHLLASILTMIALYSINIRIMSGPNVALLGQDTVFDLVTKAGVPSQYAGLIIFGAFALLVLTFIIWFLSTELGQAILATGDNPQMIRSLGVNTNTIIVLGVGLSNGLVALSGALVAQNQGAADVGMGIGTIVAGLASVIIGETVFGCKTMPRAFIAALLGSIVYRLAIALALGLEFGAFRFNPSDLNLITALLVIGALITPNLKKRLIQR
ncbi:ABC transporter permease [Desulfopila sp. IMCC35006]|uniref:ABC transporter permease n=1 Tax=Desulfopila sp. IMCC35006 TaxID=2569542 RepID=UPI0010AD44AE|nr:ABC transporter permease [Desulfopila sp. IMCC35006]TKB28499.1 ABC transporter permease [Desulfopila sp. IMCC35006]